MAGGSGFFRRKYKGGYLTPNAEKFNTKVDEATAIADASIPERVYAREVTKTPEQLLNEWYSQNLKNKSSISPDLLKDIGDKVSIEDFEAWAKSRNLEADAQAILNRLDSDLGRIDSSIKGQIFDVTAPEDFTGNYVYSDHVYYPKLYGNRPQLTSNKTTNTGENFITNPELAESNKYIPTGQKTTGWGNKTSSYTSNPMYSYKFVDPNLSTYRQSKDAHTGQIPESPNVPNRLEPSTIYLNRLLNYEQPRNSGGKLTGLGYGGLLGLALAAPYLKQNNTGEQSQTQPPYKIEPEAESESFGLNLPVASVPKEEAAEPQSEPTVEQQYVTQNIPSFNSKVNRLFDLYQQQEQLAKDKAAYEAYLRALEMGQRIANGTGYAPELNEGNFVSSQESSEINSNTEAKPRKIKDTTTGSIVLNDPNHRNTRSISGDNAIVETNNNFIENTSQIPSRNETALAQALLKARQQSLANHNDAGLQRYRYQSLMNSGLKGMTPSEAIRSGLLTPEQIQVLMRGPY